MLSENLVMLRNLKGLTQEQVAEVVEISRQSYAKWEQGETVPDIEKCDRLASFYGIKLDALMHYDEKVGNTKMAPPPEGKFLWGTVKLGNRGQIVIPKEARDKYGLQEGSRLVVLGDEEGIALIQAEKFESQLKMLMYGREAQSKTRIASPATIPKSGERNRKIHSCMLYLISI